MNLQQNPWGNYLPQKNKRSVSQLLVKDKKSTPSRSASLLPQALVLLAFRYSMRQDLNLRPLRPERSALPS